jgi:hypothetical protein
MGHAADLTNAGDKVTRGMRNTNRPKFDDNKF